jgi:hypothetical protein
MLQSFPFQLFGSVATQDTLAHRKPKTHTLTVPPVGAEVLVEGSGSHAQLAVYLETEMMWHAPSADTPKV